MKIAPQATRCSPEFLYLAEMDIACTYALSQPDVAFDAATTALHAAHELRRPDFAYFANELMGIIGAL